MELNPCPFKIGDVVRFTPTSRDIAKLSALELYGIMPNETGKIVKIEKDRYIYLEKIRPGMGLDWEMFSLK